MIIKNGKTISSIYKGSQVIDKIRKGTLVVYESWKNLIASGAPPLTLLNCKGVDLVDYKLYGNSVQNGTPTPETPIEVESVGDILIPSEYQQVEYIESTGTQYIDTGLIANNNTAAEFEYIKTNTQNMGLFGSFDTNNAGISRFAGYATNRNIYMYFGTYRANQNTVIIDVPFETTNNLKFSKEGIFLNSTLLIANKDPNEVFTTTRTMLLFAINGSEISYGKHRISRAKFYIDGTTLSFDGIPCYRKADNVIGMYDLVNDVFYANQGTGEFLKGNDKNVYKIPVKARGKNLIKFKVYGHENVTRVTNLEDLKNLVSQGYDVIWSISVNANGFSYNQSNTYYLVLEVEPNTEYSLTGYRKGDIFEYDENFNYIQTHKNIDTFTTSENAKYIFRYIYNKAQGVSVQPYTLEEIKNMEQLEKGTPTDFEPYQEPITTNIYLDEPLTINDYIHYGNQELSKNGVITNIELPNIPTIKGTTILEVDTKIQPSNLEVVYKGK